jgi:autotransporter-associated beta strand protein
MYIAAGATLDVWDGHTVYIDSLSGSGTVNKNQGSGGTVNLTLGVANGSGQFDGVIQNSRTYLSLTKAGSGLQILTGNNSYSGPTTISGGTLMIGNGGTSGSIDGTSSITNNATLVYNRSDGATLASAISGSGNLVTTGGGTFEVAVRHTYTGSTTINGGKLQLQLPSPAAAGTPVVWFDPSNPANYMLTGNNVTQLNNLGTGGNAVAIAGHGTPTLTVANSAFNGLTTVHYSGGQVLGGYDLSALNGSSYTILAVEGKASNAQLYFLGTVNGAQDQGMHFGYRGDTDFTMAQYGDDLDTPTLASVAYSGSELAREWTGMLNTAAGRSIYMNGTLEASNNGTNPFTGLGGANFGFIGAGFGYNASYVGDLGEVLIYPSALSSAQRQEVETYLEQKWELGSTGFLPVATPVTITNGGTFDLNGVNQTIGSLASSDPTTQVTLGGATLTTGNDNTSTLFAGTISGTGGLTKIGSGVFTLAASSNYAGTTSIKGGTLKLGNSGALGASGLFLTGGLLNLNGNSITVPTLDGTGGAISDLAATAGLSKLTVANSGTFAGSIQDGGSRQLALHMAGGGTLTLSGTNGYTGGTFVDSGTLIVTNPGALADGSSLTVGSAGAFPASIVPAPVAGAAVASVPEPGSLLLLAAGGALLIMVRRLRHDKR